MVHRCVYTNNVSLWLSVMTTSRGKCEAGQPLSVSQSHGVIASVVTEQTQLGSTDCPWLINAESGQTISVILHDFGMWRHNDSALQPASAVRS